MRPSKGERLRIFVTGATGAYGAHFAKLCLDLGHEVFSLRHTLRPHDTASLLGIRDKITWIDGDIRNTALLSEIMSRFEPQAVAHFAALPLVRTSKVPSRGTFSVNVEGTVALLDAAAEQVGADRRVHFLYVGTDKEYGDAGDRPYSEDMPLLGWSGYEATKIAADVMCRSYQKRGLVPHLVVSRSCNILAEADLNWRLVTNSIRQCLCDVPMQVYTRGQFVREYLAVEDAVEAQLQLLLRADEYAGQTFNIGSGEQRTQEEMIHHIREAYFPEARIVRVEPPDHSRLEIPFQKLDCAKIRRALGWVPKKAVPEAVADLVAWWREHQALAPWSML